LEKRPELNVHRDTVFDVLHTSKQGIGSTSINNTVQFLRKRGLYPQFQEFLQTFNYSGLSDKFAANLGNLSTFSGKELGQLVEIFPIALLHLRAPREWVTAWSLVSEIIVDDYCWSPLRDQLEHRKIMRVKILKRAEVTFPKLRNKFKTHLESNHETDQVEEFGPLVHQGTERFEAGNINERKLYRASNHHKPSLDIMENQRDRTYINFLFRGEWIETENGVNRICRAGEDFRKLAEHRAFANKTPIEGVHLFKTAYNKENRHLIAPIPIPKEGLFSLDRLNSALQVFAPHLPQIPNGIGFWEYEALSENGRSSSQVHFELRGKFVMDISIEDTEPIMDKIGFLFFPCKIYL